MANLGIWEMCQSWLLKNRNNYVNLDSKPENEWVRKVVKYGHILQ